MIDWIATHPDVILYLSGGVAVLGTVGAITYAGWCIISDRLRRKKECDDVMAEYRRYIQRYEEDEDNDEVIRRVL